MIYYGVRFKNGKWMTQSWKNNTLALFPTEAQARRSFTSRYNGSGPKPIVNGKIVPGPQLGTDADVIAVQLPGVPNG